MTPKVWRCLLADGNNESFKTQVLMTEYIFSASNMCWTINLKIKIVFLDCGETPPSLTGRHFSF